MQRGRQSKPLPHFRRLQFRLGTFLLIITLAGCLAGVFGPSLVRWLKRPRGTPPPALPRPSPAAVSNDLDDYYLEPAETPLD